MKRSTIGILAQQGAWLTWLTQFINKWGFWSRQSDNDYYTSLSDGSPFYSITEKQ